MRLNRMFWGSLIVIMGVLLLLQNQGVISVNIWGLFWALVLILVGAWFIIGPTLAKEHSQSWNSPLGSTKTAEIEIKHGAGKLWIESSDSGSSDLISGDFVAGIEKNVQQRGDASLVQLKPAANAFFVFPFGVRSQGFQWNMKIHPDVPTILSLHTGAGEADINLEHALVTRLELETGASNSLITMPSRPEKVTAVLKSGAAAIKIKIPKNVAAKINIQSGLMGIQVDRNRFIQESSGSYISSNYDQAPQKLDLRVEGGVGSVDIY